MTDLDNLIDRYLAKERQDGPRLGYPATAAGTVLYRSSRQWESVNETLSEASASAELTAMSGAWASLSLDEDRVLRSDATYRQREVPVPALMVPLIGAARIRLARLLAARGFFFAVE